MIAATSFAGATLSKRTSSNQRRSSTLPNGAWNTPGSNGPKPAWYLALEAVSETEPYERPWNAPRNATTYGRAVAWRASLIAVSTISVPELPRYARARPPATGVMSARRLQTSGEIGRGKSLGEKGVQHAA